MELLGQTGFSEKGQSCMKTPLVKMYFRSLRNGMLLYIVDL